MWNKFGVIQSIYIDWAQPIEIVMVILSGIYIKECIYMNALYVKCTEYKETSCQLEEKYSK